jgi:hypothetical protein
VSARLSKDEKLRRDIEAFEERLTNPGPDETRENLGALLAEDFREYGSSGRGCDAAAVVEALMAGDRSSVQFEGYRVRALGRDVALATYLARTAPGPRWVPPALRRSPWQRRDGAWRLVFHQSTRADAAESASW